MSDNACLAAIVCTGIVCVVGSIFLYNLIIDLAKIKNGYQETVVQSEDKTSHVVWQKKI